MISRIVKLFNIRLTYLLDSKILIPVGSVLQVAQEASGWIRFALTTVSVHPLICDAPFVEVIQRSQLTMR